MHLQNALKRITAYLLITAITLPLLVCAPVLDAQARSTDLYGTNSEDELNIIKLLDIALNRCGMSMDPTTIQSFLEFWLDSVKTDIDTLINNADSAITTTADFIAYMQSAAETDLDGDIYGLMIIKYLKYVGTMEYKTLSDFKQLLTQSGTFRDFLLSYIRDSDGNPFPDGPKVKNLKTSGQLNIDTALVNMVRRAADAYIEEYEGYYLLKTLTVSDLLPNKFYTKEEYDKVIGLLKQMDSTQAFFFSFYSYSDRTYYFYDVSKANYVLQKNGKQSEYFAVYLYTDNWTSYPSISGSFSYHGSELKTDLVSLPSEQNSNYSFSSCNIFVDGFQFINSNYGSVFTTDGRSIKIWKSLDAFKQSSVGKSNVYYTKDYSEYDDSKDNGYTFTGNQYNGSYSHDTIQNTIDNSTTTIDESTVNNIVNNYINNYYTDSSGGGGSGDSPGGSGGGSWSGSSGSGIGDFMNGIQSILDFILSLLGSLLDLLGTFLDSVLKVLERITDMGSGFGDFIKAAFSFLPAECYDLIFLTIAAICAVGLIKMIKG